MKIEANTPEEYIAQLPEDRKLAITKLRQIILENLPVGFEETISYGMIGYVVPHTAYSPGYHCNSKLPLPFINIASQKNFIALYHFGIYNDPALYNWFVEQYPKYSSRKLDMGKSCIRFKNLDAIPYKLIGALVRKISMPQWIENYEATIKR
ncbi:DUF1801 domain-containing protein [Gillisia sp. M10.2A]|uniref:DUF1801 domain-containing protein n=1 Tax=Gillisia lutea TaxID=2909668 RepID=A0ABS9EM73_9FLAO|nr:DUF1801 domain-containing protein [Gillisia lutea]MCF4102526.1 DUF1801 domain-containing protein [Gillisia lutea]